MLLTKTNGRAAAEWCNGVVLNNLSIDVPTALVMPTLEGEMRADVGDYIIKGVKGEFYPCKPDIFRQTYAEVPVKEQLKQQPKESL